MALKLRNLRYTKTKSTFHAIKLFYGGSKRFPVFFKSVFLWVITATLHRVIPKSWN